MEKQAKREKKLAEKKAKRIAKEGPKKEDGTWAKYWYQNIHNSTTFLPYEERKILLKKEEDTLYKECLPFYNFLTEKSIKL